MDWAATQQRAFQNEMAAAVRAIKSGAPAGWAALLLAAGAYGVVHAAGPGHGKYLIGGVGLGSSVPASRMIALAVASSLAQAIWAVVLVYGGFWLLQLSADNLTMLAEQWLAPASYLAIAVVGIVVALRGLRNVLGPKSKVPEHAGHDGCGHAHGPDPDQVASLQTLREAAALVASIAIRPCTGAIFLLVIAWQLDIKAAGFAATVAMGLGTAILTSAVAISSVALRGMAMFSGRRAGAIGVAAPVLQIIAGVMIFWFSLALLSISIL
ncbi:MAG: ABC-type nickel/cobalt efflux system permease component RcnA [Paracoccaceae bacterium]|jgi:ABC-type nickel/cobalt efflux system permease component RcnA